MIISKQNKDMAATKNYYSFLDEEIREHLVQVQTPKKEKFPSLASTTTKPKIVLPEFSVNTPVNYRTKECSYGRKCYQPSQCQYYHSEGERRIAIYQDGVWVNARYTKEREQAKEEFREARTQRNRELVESGKWKTVECSRTDDHFLEDCPYHHGFDFNTEGPKLQIQKRQEDFLVAQLKKGKTLRWG